MLTVRDFFRIVNFFGFFGYSILGWNDFGERKNSGKNTWDSYRTDFRQFKTDFTIGRALKATLVKPYIEN